MPIDELSQGYLKPTNPTSGDQFFSAIEQNIQRVNDDVEGIRADIDSIEADIESIESDISSAEERIGDLEEFEGSFTDYAKSFVESEDAQEAREALGIDQSQVISDSEGATAALSADKKWNFVDAAANTNDSVQPVSLPSAAQNVGREIAVMQVTGESSTKSTAVLGHINGSADQVDLAKDGAFVEFVSDGDTWWIIRLATDPIAVPSE